MEAEDAEVLPGPDRDKAEARAAEADVQSEENGALGFGHVRPQSCQAEFRPVVVQYLARCWGLSSRPLMTAVRRCCTAQVGSSTANTGSGAHAGMRAAVVFALAALGLAAVQLVWTLWFLDGAADGAAFAMALLALVALPACLAASAVSLLPSGERTVRLSIVGAVGLAGLAAAGIIAGFFIADEPADPAWIAVVAAAVPFALIGSAALAGIAYFRAFADLKILARLALTVPLAAVTAVVIAFLALQATVALLAAVALPVVLLIARIRRQRPAAAEPQ